ncbi:MAG: ATP-binding protein [Candidatus Ratteibacteria bacterium]
MCHAFIIHGGSGTTRKESGYIAAKILECEKSPEICGECYPCRTISSNNYPDVHLIQPEKRNLSIDEVRNIQQQMYTKPYMSKYRIFIIETDWMQAPAANSLLKILEEPPSYGIIIILARNNKNFLPTIVSRTINLPLNLEIDIPIKDDKTLKKIFEMFEAATDRNWKILFETAGDIAKNFSREDIENVFDSLILMGREHLLQNMETKQFRLPDTSYSGIIKIANFRILADLIDKRQYLRFNVNSRIFLTAVALEISSPKWRNWQTR